MQKLPPINLIYLTWLYISELNENAAFETQTSTQQLLRLLPKEICIFFNVHQQIIAQAKLF